MKVSAIRNFSFQKRIQDQNLNPVSAKMPETINEEKAVFAKGELANAIDEMFNTAKAMRATSEGVVDDVQDEIEEITRTYKPQIREARKLLNEAGDNVEVDEFGVKTIKEFTENNEPKRTLTLRPNGNLTIEDFENNVVVQAKDHDLLSVVKNEENTEEGKKYSFFIEYENGVPCAYAKNYTETSDGKISADKKFEFTRGIVTPLSYKENYQSEGKTSSADKQVNFQHTGINIYDFLERGIPFRWADLIAEYDENINYGNGFWTIDKAVTFAKGDLEKYAENTTHIMGVGDKSDKQLLFKNNEPALYFDKVSKQSGDLRQVEKTYALEGNEWVPSKKWHT